MRINSPQVMEAAIALTRFGLGARPGDLQSVNARAWLNSQIRPDGADRPQGALANSRDNFASLLTLRQEVKTAKQASPMPVDMNSASNATNPAADLKDVRKMAVRPLLESVRNEIFARFTLASSTDAPFRERWALFWANHFTVSTAKLQSAVLAGPFEREAIRPHVFGRFEDMLVASSTHPGMLVYLDQVRSAGPDSAAGTRRKLGLNENLAREIMELHSLGADAGYTQVDVTEFARALTGYSIGAERDGSADQGAFLFRPLLHEPGTRTVMGKPYAQAGEDQARAILHDLAGSPKTAHHLATKIATHFVADEPQASLVERLKATYLNSNGDLSAMAKTLISAPECWGTEAKKLKTPYEFLVSSYRAIGAVARDPGKEVVQPLTALGQRPFAAPQPNGWSDLAADWAAPGALVKRLDWALGFSQFYAPVSGALVDSADAVLGPKLSELTRSALARAESRTEALALLLMSPEFQRR